MPDQSKPVPLEAEVVEAAAKAYMSHPGLTDERLEAAILAADEARGVGVERQMREIGWNKTVEYSRLVSAWKPIKGPVDE